ncbi:unnamed protein product [Protopolystoma xenopodis]|uniref:Uncharacterized protein n=1 Tax=Protopolystoma xenopodis TaxID=117903 RepID=A0A448XDM3_9PLAT|nr:unnamed protein product [Protopolystoma xenopodis]
MLLFAMPVDLRTRTQSCATPFTPIESRPSQFARDCVKRTPGLIDLFASTTSVSREVCIPVDSFSLSLSCSAPFLCTPSTQSCITGLRRSSGPIVHTHKQSTLFQFHATKAILRNYTRDYLVSGPISQYCTQMGLNPFTSLDRSLTPKAPVSPKLEHSLDVVALFFCVGSSLSKGQFIAAPRPSSGSQGREVTHPNASPLQRLAATSAECDIVDRVSADAYIRFAALSFSAPSTVQASSSCSQGGPCSAGGHVPRELFLNEQLHLSRFA